MQTNPAVEQNKKLNDPRVHGIRPVGKEKIYGGKDLPKSEVLSSEWKTERVREYESGDSEEGEDDELPCDRWKWRRLCLTRLAKISGEFVNRFRQGAAYRKERLPVVIFKEDGIGVQRRAVASLVLVSPGAATDGVNPIFPGKNWRPF